MIDFVGRYRKQVKFLLVGVWNTLFGYGTFAVLYAGVRALHWHYMVALLGSQTIAVANAYVSYKRLVFKTEGNVARESLRFLAVYGLLFGGNLLALPLLVGRGGMGPMAAQALIVAVSAALSYTAHNFFTFAALADKTERPVEAAVIA